ncbi:hypothetical protein B0H13DRAFT_1866309 [Mycena leptocephala]|nr:hypothetical protein B0H13DRAFT_1866309 [Mycena leptocephala]
MQFMWDFVHGEKKCYTLQMTGFMDGIPRSCTDLEQELPCEICKADGLDGVKAGPKATILKPKNPSLMWSGGASQCGVKCKLKEVFGSATEAAVEKTGKKACARPDAITTLQRCLKRVGKACGFCFALGVQNPQAHSPDSCPSMSDVDGDPCSTFRRLKATIHYPEEGGACFKCHIASFGRDILHPKIQRGRATCTHPNFVLPMAVAMHHNRHIRGAAAVHLEPKEGEWEDINRFAEWFLAPHAKYQFNSMAMLAHFGASH